MAALAATVAVVVSLPLNLAPTTSHQPSTAEVMQAQPIASPSEAFFAAGDSWWSMLQETTQPLAGASELIAQPDFEAISDAFACRQTNLASWEQFGGPIGDATSRAMEFFYTLPGFHIFTAADSDSSG